MEFSALTAMAEVQSIVGQLGSHKPKGVANFFLIIEKLNQCYKSNLRSLFRTADYPQVIILYYPLLKSHNQWLRVFLIWGRRAGSRSICVLWEILLPPRNTLCLRLYLRLISVTLHIIPQVTVFSI